MPCLRSRLACAAPLLAGGLIALHLSPPPAAALGVAGTSPSFYALGVPAGASITVTFDAPLDPGTVSSSSVIVRGLGSGIHPASLAVNGATLVIDPPGSFPPGEIVTVNLTSALRAQGGAALAGGYSFQFTIAVAGGMLSFQEIGRWSTAPAFVPYFIYGGDLDRNGTPDAAVPNEDSHDLSVFLNAGDGVLDQHTEYGVGSTPSSCFGDDLDGDGDLDLATANINSHDMTVLLNDGGGTFAPGTSYAGGTTCRQVYGGDFDGDGDTDLATTGFSENTLNLHFNQGDGTFAPRTVIAAGSGPFPVFAGDMNRDGRPDLVVGYQGTPRQVKVFLNQGGGTFAAGATLAVGGGAWDFFGNDLDGDGDLDLALAEASANRVRILYGDGAGGFASSIVIATGSFPLAVFLADLDGDGDQEVLASDFGGRDVRVFRNAGGGLFPLAATLPTIQAGSYAWAHDLDADGDLDLTVIDELANFIFTFRNQGQPASAPGGGASPPAALRLLPPYPNPARGIVTLGFEAPAAAGRLRLRLYDAGGRLVHTLLDGPPPDGGRAAATWDGRAGGGSRVAAGVYFVRLEGGGRTATRRLELLK